jgi:hypothetical protein
MSMTNGSKLLQEFESWKQQKLPPPSKRMLELDSYNTILSELEQAIFQTDPEESSPVSAPMSQTPPEVTAQQIMDMAVRVTTALTNFLNLLGIVRLGTLDAQNLSASTQWMLVQATKMPLQLTYMDGKVPDPGEVLDAAKLYPIPPGKSVFEEITGQKSIPPGVYGAGYSWTHSWTAGPGCHVYGDSDGKVHVDYVLDDATWTPHPGYEAFVFEYTWPKFVLNPRPVPFKKNKRKYGKG